MNEAEPWVSAVYGQKHDYSDAILAAGGVPVFIPFMPENELKELYSRLDGIVFAGGNDINPQLYGETPVPQTKDISDERDRVESLLMRWTLADDKPLLAICRGFQLFNVVLGGSLYQDIPTDLPDANDHELTAHKKDYTLIAHRLQLEPDTHLARITSSLQLDANSRHHQAIKTVGEGLRVSARSEDGVIEGLEHSQKTFAVGVQCHPESLAPLDEKWAHVFKTFVEHATKLY